MAPSVALAILALTISQDGKTFAAEEARAMFAGAAAFAACAFTAAALALAALAWFASSVLIWRLR